MTTFLVLLLILAVVTIITMARKLGTLRSTLTDVRFNYKAVEGQLTQLEARYDVALKESSRLREEARLGKTKQPRAKRPSLQQKKRTAKKRN